MTYILALDQGTTSTRAIVFDHRGRSVSSGQLEHRQIFPRAGWVEHDATEIWRNTQEVIGVALARADITRHDIAAIGITNQRETVILWDRRTGQPVHNAIVWQDTRSQGIVDRLAADGGVDRFRGLTGLPLASYFSATKIAWVLENLPDAKRLADEGHLAFGTPDTWLLWNLTGGPEGGVHATDVTNASRTLLMNLETLEWDASLLEAFGIPESLLPDIRSSSEVYGHAEPSSLLREVPIAGMMGDQQAATFGQAAFAQGDSKNTYGTGNFLVVNTGDRPIISEHGLLTTVAYRLGDGTTAYALEGSIAVTGSLVQWLRDNLGIIGTAAEVETLANEVEDAGGVIIVPAFSGLFAPHWRPDARGAILGLTRFADRRHIARAALESVALQSREVVDAACADLGSAITELRVDGGMVANGTLMQMQADALGIPVIRPANVETTALGAAFAAGLAVGYWSGLTELTGLWSEDRRWEPASTEAERTHMLARWQDALGRTLDWPLG
ncbi:MULTISPECIES: glycerol kinase GlpK [Bacteria]